jgi:hypothetical protein
VLSQIHWQSEPLSAAQSGAVMSTMMVGLSVRRGGRSRGSPITLPRADSGAGSPAA